MIGSWKPKYQKYKGRVVLPASHVPAAKVMDVIARLSDCDGQAADTVSAYTQVKTEDAPKLSKKQRQNVQIFGCVFHDKNGPNPGQTLKVRWFLTNEICTVTHLQASCARCNFDKFCWNWDGKKYRSGSVCFFTESWDYSYRYTWTTS